MKTEEIIERLRHPQKYNKRTKQKSAQITMPVAHPPAASPLNNLIILGIAACVMGIAAIAWVVVLNAKNRAENLTAALDPAQVQGLSYDTQFNPRKTVSYVEIYEGQDRNVAVDQLGTTLPVISRYNYRAITPKNYGVIGMAPWALTENFAANLQDVQVIRYLLNRKEVGEAFIARSDVAPLLQDPQLLAAFAQDTQTLNDFFSNTTIQSVLNNPEMVRAVGASRLMSLLLTSKAVKYYRNHPQEALSIIKASPVLSELRQNPGIRQAILENYYLKSLAPQLLDDASVKRGAKK